LLFSQSVQASFESRKRQANMLLLHGFFCSFFPLLNLSFLDCLPQRPPSVGSSSCPANKLFSEVFTVFGYLTDHLFSSFFVSLVSLILDPFFISFSLLSCRMLYISCRSPPPFSPSNSLPHSPFLRACSIEYPPLFVSTSSFFLRRLGLAFLPPLHSNVNG